MNPPCLKFVGPLKLVTTVIVLAGIMLPSLSWSQSQTTDIRPHALRLAGDEIKAEFSGQTHEGAYNFNAGGQARNNYVETHQKDGRTIYKEQGFANRGVWFVSNETLCFVYDNDMMGGGCFRVYKVENCYYFYSDQFEERTDELDRNYWTARSVRQGEVPKCEAAIS